MTNQSLLSKTSNTSLKIFTGIFAFYVLISTLSILPMLFQGTNTLVFYDGLKRLVLNAFYIFIGFNLLKLIYNLKSGLVDLIAQRSVKILAHIWYALVGLLLFKLVTELIFRYQLIPRVADATLANELGYSRKMAIAPHADLLIAICMVWIFLYVLNYALKLKQEQDLTI